MGKVKILFTRYQFLIRLIVTILLASTIPAIIFNWNMMNYVYRDTIDRNHKYYAAIVADMHRNFTEQMAQMRTTSIKISYEKLIVQQRVESHNYNYILAIKDIESYSRSIPSSDEMFIFFEDSNYVLSSKAKYEMDFIVSYYSDGDEYLAGRIADLFTNDGERRMVSNFGSVSHGKGRLFVSLPVDGSSTAVFSITQESLNRFLFGSVSDEYIIGFMIFDSGGNLVITNNDIVWELSSSEKFTSFLSDKTSFQTDIEANGISLYKSFDDGITCILAMQQAHMQQTIGSFYKFTERMVIIVIGLLLISVFMTVYLNYKPIRRMIKRFSTSKDRVPLSELGVFEYAILQARQENEEISETLQSQRRNLTDFAFQNLVNGYSIGEDKVAELGLRNDREHYFVIAVQGASLNDREKEEMEKTISDGCNVFSCITNIYQEKYLFILCGSNDPSPDKSKQTARYIYNSLLNGTYAGLTMGVGKVVNGLMNIRASYLGAISAVESGNGSLIMVENVVDQFSAFTDDHSEIVLKFLQYVRQGSKAQALYALKELIDYIAANATTRVFEKILCTSILEAYLRMLAKLKVALPGENADNMLRVDDLNEFSEQMTISVENVCDEIARNIEDKKKELAVSLVRFIDDNFLDPGICLNMISGEFGISIYTVSRLFKEYTGRGYKEYVTDKRLEYSKKLLLTTDKSVKDVARLSGFIDAAGFNKLFKQECGVTPVKYRT